MLNIESNKSVTIYTTSWCEPCKNAKRLLLEKQIHFVEIDIEESGISREDLYEITGGRTVPQIVINNKSIGGYDDLLELESTGQLKI